MQRPDFKAAHLQAPSRRSSDPSWLEGCAGGREVHILGGAYGLANSSGLERAAGQIVIGTNWTLRALEPSLWLVVDANVWKEERSRLAGCSSDLVVVANKGIFGGGPYSTAGSRAAKMVGTKPRTVAEVAIGNVRGGMRIQRGGKGVYQSMIVPPYMPKSFREPLHPGGNSLCYGIQLAHLMGAGQVYAHGFTMDSGTPYFFGRTNPATRRESFYQVDRPLEWLRWHAKEFPGMVLLMPGWDGPIYSVFKTAEFCHVNQDVLAIGGTEQPDQDAGATVEVLGPGSDGDGAMGDSGDEVQSGQAPSVCQPGQEVP